jgi:hypothetical protein
MPDAAAPASRQARRMITFQRLTLRLDGITAGDYLAYVRDPEPPGLGTALRSVEIDAEPLGSEIHVVLAWHGTPPAPAVAELLAGFPITPQVTRVTCRRLAAVAA